MKLATWNVNSIRMRLDRVLAWLGSRAPDVVCLQEIKILEDGFPFEPLRAAGYHAVVCCQKTYNGVAILSKSEPTEVVRGFGDGGEPEEQARFISARIDGVRVMCCYAPNGQAVGTDKWLYKLAWYARLKQHVAASCDRDDEVALCGDLNVAPEPRDVHDPALWEETVLYHPQARAALAELVSWGLVDVFRRHHDEPGLYSWWDYRMLAFPKNKGLRIDHILATQKLAARSTGALIDRDQRKGQQPSDHAPVIATFE